MLLKLLVLLKVLENHKQLHIQEKELRKKVLIFMI